MDSKVLVRSGFRLPTFLIMGLDRKSRGNRKSAITIKKSLLSMVSI